MHFSILDTLNCQVSILHSEGKKNENLRILLIFRIWEGKRWLLGLLYSQNFFSRFTLLFTLSPLLSLQDHSIGHFK